MLDVNERFLPGSLGDVSECESYGSSEGLSSHQGNNKLPVRPTQTSLGVLEIRPHLPVTRSSSGPHDQRGQPQSSLHQGLSGQSGSLSSDNLAERTGHPACPLLKVRTNSLSPLQYSGQLRETHISHSTPSLFTCKPDPQTPQQSQQSNAPHTVDTADAAGPGQEKGPGAPNWQTERWHIWQILSKDNADALPETLVWCTLSVCWTILISYRERRHSPSSVTSSAEMPQSVFVCSTVVMFLTDRLMDLHTHCFLDVLLLFYRRAQLYIYINFIAYVDMI